MIYLASPYTHSDPLIMKTRFLIAEQVTAHLLKEGQFVYSPIVHCHELALKYALPTDYKFWRAYNTDMLRRADRFYILTIDGWEASQGVFDEHQLARRLGLPVEYITDDGFISAELCFVAS